jgi:tetratricopeptide (TPR) repeat protein
MLERLAMAAYLVGRDVESEELLARAHQSFLSNSDPASAARCAVWITFGLFSRGDRARAAGWAQRAHRLIDDGHVDSAEQGYLIVQSALKAVGEGDVESARQRFGDAAAIGERFGDRDLVNLARQGQGRTLIRLGQTTAGVALLDEVMVAVTQGELSPIITGTIYCSVVDACFDMFDLRRAHEWTEALDGWCASQPDLVPYRGSCRVHRAEIMVLRGRWDEAMREAERASAPGSAQTLGSAWYQRAEIHRLRGELAKAEDAYRKASDAGRSPQPGLALCGWRKAAWRRPSPPSIGQPTKRASASSARAFWQRGLRSASRPAIVPGRAATRTSSRPSPRDCRRRSRSPSLAHGTRLLGARRSRWRADGARVRLQDLQDAAGGHGPCRDGTART